MAHRHEPNITINWTARGDKVTVPIGLGIGRMFSLGLLPIRVDIEAEYAVIHSGRQGGQPLGRPPVPHSGAPDLSVLAGC